MNMEVSNHTSEVGGRSALTVLECGAPPPLSRGGTAASDFESARTLAQSNPKLSLSEWSAVRGPWTFAFCFLLSGFCLGAWGQYAIDWSTIDGGGGTSTGGVYSVSGTIDQPDAGVMSGGNYTFVDGFWGLIDVVQTPGAPTLTVTRTTTNTVAVSWPGPEAGWRLQFTTALLAASSIWTEIPPPCATKATCLYFVEPKPVGKKFYWLHKP